MSKKKAKRPVKTAAKKKATTSTALVRRAPTTISVSNPRGVRDTDLALDRVIGEGVLLGALGLVEVKLTDKEEAVLAEPVNASDVRLRPGKKGPAIPYLPHIVYTKWFNRALGRTGWNIVPVSKPILAGGKGKSQSLVCNYVLYIHGQPVATAAGEQDYFEDNSQQSYGDALESTVASALRRCAKRLGIGLEMWDKDFCDRMRRERQSTLAPADRGNEDRPQQPQGNRPPPPPAPNRPPAATRTGQETEKITHPQRERLAHVAKKAGRTGPEVAAYLRDVYKIKTSKDIMRKNYDAIVTALERRGPLQGKPSPAREPDEVLPPLKDSDIQWGLD